VVQTELDEAPRLIPHLQSCYDNIDEEYCDFEWDGFMIPAKFEGSSPSVQGEKLMTRLRMTMYAVRGMYAFHLKYWFNHFDQSQFYFGFFEDMIQDPDAYVHSLNQFIGVPDGYPHGLVPSIVKPTTMDQHDRRQLCHFYRPHNKDLSFLLQRPLPFSWTDDCIV